MAEVIKKIKFTLPRDATNEVSNFFPLWLMICDSRLQSKNESEEYRLSWTLFRCIIQQIKCKFDKRQAAFAQYHIYTLTQAEGVIMMEFLVKHPIPPEQFYLRNLRQSLIDIIHAQI